MQFKTTLCKARYIDLSSTLRMILGDADHYLQTKYGIELFLTETVTTLDEDEKVGRKSRTHREARAADSRTIGISAIILADLKQYILAKYNDKFGAISPMTGEPTLIVDNTHGTGPHWHWQVRVK